MHSVTDGQTDDSMMPIADHTICAKNYENRLTVIKVISEDYSRRFFEANPCNYSATADVLVYGILGIPDAY